MINMYDIRDWSQNPSFATIVLLVIYHISSNAFFFSFSEQEEFNKSSNFIGSGNKQHFSIQATHSSQNRRVDLFLGTNLQQSSILCFFNNSIDN